MIVIVHSLLFILFIVIITIFIIIVVIDGEGQGPTVDILLNKDITNLNVIIIYLYL